MRERIDAITNLRPATPRHAAVGSPPSWPTAGPPRKGSFLTSGGCDELHKITAGSGYDYLTRQVAVQDSTEKGHLGAGVLHTQRGHPLGESLSRSLTASW